MPRPDLPPLPGNVRLQVLPPADAVAAFQARGLLSPTFSWLDLSHEEHAHQFTVAKLFQTDLLAEIYRQLGLALTEGKSLKDFQNDLIPTLQRGGWWGDRVEVTDPATGETGVTKVDPSRLALIYDVNLRNSYAAGRWARAQRSPLPYLIYVTKRDERVRLQHQQWDAIALPKDHPWWDTHYPPNGWRCRCLAYAIDEAGIKALEAAGLVIRREPPDDGPPIPFINKRTGEVTEVPPGIDPGWAYNVGKAAAQALGRLAAEKLDAVPRDIAAAAVKLISDEAAIARFLAAPQGSIPLVVLPEADLAKIGTIAQTARLSADTAIKQAASHGELTAAEYAQAQRVVDLGLSIQDTPRSMIYVLEESSSVAGGYVLVVKATLSGEGLWVTSYRRLSRQEALREAEIARLLEREKK